MLARGVRGRASPGELRGADFPSHLALQEAGQRLSPLFQSSQSTGLDPAGGSAHLDVWLGWETYGFPRLDGEECGLLGQQWPGQCPAGGESRNYGCKLGGESWVCTHGSQMGGGHHDFPGKQPPSPAVATGLLPLREAGPCLPK